MCRRRRISGGRSGRANGDVETAAGSAGRLWLPRMAVSLPRRHSLVERGGFWCHRTAGVGVRVAFRDSDVNEGTELLLGVA